MQTRYDFDWNHGLIADLQQGVALSVASLILALSQSHQDAYQPAVGVAVERLHQVTLEMFVIIAYSA